MKIKNWEKFQHYKNRWHGAKLPWIKLYHTLLDDPEWHSLDGESVKVLVMCWLVACDHGGELPSARVLAFRLRMTEKQLSPIISKLSHWLYEDPRESLDSVYSPARQEKDEEEEKEEDKSKKVYRPALKRGPHPKVPLPEDWNPKEALSAEELRELLRFKDSARAHDRRYADWNAAWRNWKSSPYNKGNSNGSFQVHANKEPRRGSRDDTRERMVQALDALDEFVENGPRTDGQQDSGEASSPVIGRIPKLKLA